MSFTARVRYTEPMLRLAVRTFMWRRMLRRAWLWGLVAGLLGISLVLSLVEGPGVVTGVAGASLVFLVVMVGAVWRAHHANTIGRFRAMAPPEADVTFGAEGVSVASSLGTATMVWGTFQEAWAMPGFWMLFLGPAQFMTVPLETLPAEMVAFGRARLPFR